MHFMTNLDLGISMITCIILKCIRMAWWQFQQGRRLLHWGWNHPLMEPMIQTGARLHWKTLHSSSWNTNKTRVLLVEHTRNCDEYNSVDTEFPLQGNGVVSARNSARQDCLIVFWFCIRPSLSEYVHSFLLTHGWNDQTTRISSSMFTKHIMAWNTSIHPSIQPQGKQF